MCVNICIYVYIYICTRTSRSGHADSRLLPPQKGSKLKKMIKTHQLIQKTIQNTSGYPKILYHFTSQEWLSQ